MISYLSCSKGAGLGRRGAGCVRRAARRPFAPSHLGKDALADADVLRLADQSRREELLRTGEAARDRWPTADAGIETASRIGAGSAFGNHPPAITVKRGNRVHGPSQSRLVRMVVVVRHGGGGMAHDGLHDDERHARVRREGDERVAERMECRGRRAAVSPFIHDALHDASAIEDAVESL